MSAVFPADTAGGVLDMTGSGNTWGWKIGTVADCPALILTYPDNPLALYLVQATGGMRAFLWEVGQPVPDIPHTSVLPTFAVHGDILVGDIVALMSNPMTYFIRADAGIPVSAVTQIFSSRNIPGNEGDEGVQKGSTITMAPQTGGSDNDGYLSLCAYGSGSGADANMVRFERRTAANTIAESARFDKDGHLVPGSDAAYDFGLPGKRVRTIFTRSLRRGDAGHNFIDERSFAADNAITGWTTLCTISPSTVTGVYTGFSVSMHAAGDTGSVGNGVRKSEWYASIANGPPTVSIIGTDEVAGFGAAQLRLLASGNDVLVQAASSNGTGSLGGLIDVVTRIGKPSGTAATFEIT